MIEVYLLLSSVAILAAAVAAIILFEKRSKAGREQVGKALQSLSECLQELQRFHASTAAKFGEADSASAQRTQYIAEAQAKIAGDSLEHLLKKLGENAGSLRDAYQASEQRFEKLAEGLAERFEKESQTSAERARKESQEHLNQYRELNKEVCDQLLRMTEALSALKASLEESVKF